MTIHFGEVRRLIESGAVSVPTWIQQQKGKSMITKLSTHRGYTLFFQECSDFIGVYARPNIGHYLGQTLAQAQATIDAILDAPEDGEECLDEVPAGWCDSEQPIIV